MQPNKNDQVSIKQLDSLHVGLEEEREHSDRTEVYWGKMPFGIPARTISPFLIVVLDRTLFEDSISIL